jgi:hypothetical protein
VGRWLASGLEARIASAVAVRQASADAVLARLAEVTAREKRVAEREVRRDVHVSAPRICVCVGRFCRQCAAGALQAKAAAREKKLDADRLALTHRAHDVEAAEAAHLLTQKAASAEADAVAAQRQQLAIDIQLVRELHATYSVRVTALTDALTRLALAPA